MYFMYFIKSSNILTVCITSKTKGTSSNAHRNLNRQTNKQTNKHAYSYIFSGNYVTSLKQENS
jgi:hypothetical protein